MDEIRCWVVTYTFSNGLIDGFPIFGKSVPSHDDIVTERMKSLGSVGGKYQMQGPFPVPGLQFPITMEDYGEILSEEAWKTFCKMYAQNMGALRRAREALEKQSTIILDLQEKLDELQGYLKSEAGLDAEF